MKVINKDYIKSIMPKRTCDTNKYDVGSLLCVCGSQGYAGAAVFALKGALRMGAGIVRCALPKSIYPIVSSAVPEAVYLPMEENSEGAISRTALKEILRAADHADAVLLGCGSKLCEDTKAIAFGLIGRCKSPLLIDADGINALAEHIYVLNESRAPIVLTPHEGEMSRLAHTPSDVIRADRAFFAREFADEWDVTLVLKGKETLIAEKGKECLVNPTGNSGMATAGSGDVLSGMIASLMAQGVEPFEAAACGVFLHGLAGDMAKHDLTEYSMLPSDMILRIPVAIKRTLDL